MPMPLINK